MSGRSYLSIGDVLSLLREEFPDVTISKIRFLESQGLVDPERSPSGYRKFYEHDVERLRWVLRQQREHFLPLKVIRDRLAAAGNGVPSDDPYEPVTVPGAESADAGAFTGDVAPADSAGSVPAYDAPVSGGAAREGASADTVAPPEWLEPPVPDPGEPAEEALLARARLEHSPGHGSVNGDAASLLAGNWPSSGAGAPSGPGGQPAATAARVAGQHVAAPGHVAATERVIATDHPPVAASAPSPSARSGLQDHVEPARASATQPAWAPQAGDPPTGGGSPPGSSPTEPSDAPSPSDESGNAGASSTGDATPAGGPAAPETPAAPGIPATPAAPAPSGASADVLAPALSGASLTLDELCAATGLSPAGVASLESFGLIAPMAVAGASYYDEEALTVAKLVVEFGKYGIEPRHLRLYRNAVEREVGLVEQIITPLLRQRNPEARQRAVESAAELVRLGQGLRSSLVRTELRRQLGT